MRFSRFSAFVLTTFLASLSSTSSAAPELSFAGNTLRPFTVTPDITTGLDAIYVLYDTKDVNLLFPSNNPSIVKVYKYSNLGGGYAEEISNIEIVENGIRVNDIIGNLGYIFEEGTARYYYWITDYHDFRFKIESIELSAVSDCDATVLDVVGNAGPIHYFTINGQQRELSRDIRIIYDTQEFDVQLSEYVTKEKESLISSFENTIRISPASLSYSSYSISGDRFLEFWNWASELESRVFPPSGVAVSTSAVQEDITLSDSPEQSDDPDSESESDNSASNVIKGDDSNLGGSAPAEISFYAYVSENVIHYEWQMSKDPEFETIDNRFNIKDLQYTFLEEGTFYFRFIGSNSDGSCSTVSDTYTVSIGASELLCPNAFSPDGDGVNDIWKVSYRSITDFNCWIYDRYGALLCHFTNPQDGWDGKRGGKYVKSGVYYYVITAQGADGKKYKKSGDINILRKRTVAGSSSGEIE